MGILEDRPEDGDAYVARFDGEAASITVEFAWDARASRTAFTRVGPWAVSYWDSHVEEDTRSRLGALCRALPTDLGRRALSDAVEARAAQIGWRMASMRWVRATQILPRWPCWCWVGSPRLRGPLDLWPFDAELAGVKAGLRRLIKREWPSVEDAREDRAWLRSQGLAVSVQAEGGTPGRVFFASSDATLLRDAAEAERALPAGDSAEARRAVRWFGDALGYPRCCVERFLATRRRDDIALAAERLPATGSPAAPALTTWLHGALSLLSHIPCDTRCAASLELAGGVLAELEHSTPGFADAWLKLARNVHVLTTEGRSMTLGLDGSPDMPCRVLAAVELRPPRGRFDAVAWPVQELVGAEWTVGVGLYQFGPHVTSFVADHRALR